VVLVLSGAILGGCNRRQEQTATDWTTGTNKQYQVVTNDTYIPGRGYYHSYYHSWFPFPYNYYQPGRGYYRGGAYHPEPDLKIQPPTTPGRASSPDAIKARAARDANANVNRGGFTRSRSWSSSS
jgi:hypothetical protein